MECVGEMFGESIRCIWKLGYDLEYCVSYAV